MEDRYSTQILPDMTIEYGVARGGYMGDDDGSDIVPSLKDEKAIRVKEPVVDVTTALVPLSFAFCLTVFPIAMQMRNFMANGISEYELIVNASFIIPGLIALYIGLLPFIRKSRIKKADDINARVLGYVKANYIYNGMRVYDMYLKAATEKGEKLIKCHVYDKKPYRRGESIEIKLCGKTIRFAKEDDRI